DQQAGNRGCVLKRGADDLGRVDHAGFDEVLILFGLGVEALGRVIAFEQLARDDRAVMAGVAGNLADQGRQRLADNVDAAGLVVIGAVHALERLGGVEERGTAARNDAFLDRGAGRVKRVIDAVLALLDLDLGSTADLDHGYAAGKLGQPLLQLLAIIVGGGRFDLLTDRANPSFDILAGPVAVNNRGVVLV